MASDLPRGGIASNRGFQVNAAVTIPAVAGIIHILDGFTAFLVNSGAAVEDEVLVNTSDLILVNFQIGELYAPTGSGTIQIATDSDEGLGVQGGPGASMTVSTSGATASTIAFLRIKWHDI